MSSGTPPAQGEPIERQPTAAPEDSAPPAATVVLTLTLWTTDAFSPTQAITTGQVLAQQVSVFEAARPDVRLQFVLKQPYGKGGILDYLLTTAPVVPDLLPDLVFIDVNELDDAVQAELVQPLDEQLPPDLVADLYPFSGDACRFDGRLYGLQFQSDLDHLVYNASGLADPPGSWAGVLSTPGRYLFPAGGEGGLVNDAFLVQYLAVRGQPSGASSQEPFLDEASLVAVLQYYQDGMSRGIFPPAILDYHTPDDCWSDYLAGRATMTHVSAHRYLTDRDHAQGSAPAPIPAISGPGAAISRGWALALVTRDPMRQAAAIEFLIQWMAPETNGMWNQAAAMLPTRQAALPAWDQAQNGSYTRFIEQQLLTAQSRPRALGNYAPWNARGQGGQVAAALQQAIEAVLSGSLTPEEAAAQVMSNGQ